MNSRTIAIIIFIIGTLVLIAVAAIFFLNSQDETPDAEAEAEATVVVTAVDDEGNVVEQILQNLPSDEEAVATPEFVEVVVSLQTVPRGHQMTSEILALDMRDRNTVGSNVIQNIDEAIDLYARTDIFQGETLTRDSLVRNPTTVGIEEYGPSWLIPEGFIAAAIPLDLLSGVGYSLSEGDYIDIMASFNLYRIDEQFQTFLENDAVFFVDEFLDTVEEGNPPKNDESFQSQFDERTFFVVDGGRFEEMANGDLALVSPSELQRPIQIAMILQNAKIIQVGQYVVPEPASAQIPTPTVEVVVAEGEPTPTPESAPPPTATPEPPTVMVVALIPQQQLFLKHAVEVGATIDFALRSVDDNQLFNVDQLDLQFLLEFFDIQVPPNFDYTIEDENPSSNDTGNGNGEATATPNTSQDAES
ncbi:MAG: hypothetical protein GY943_32980 [Chloroflexi bacterium]|nr:hypothetical protein [Chloroflexota bacterium]